MFVFSPLEQFQIIPLIPITLASYDISFTNSALIGFITIFFIFFTLNTLLKKDFSFAVIPSNWQVIFESLYKMISQLLKDNLGEEGQKFIPFIFSLFTFILFSNLIGLIPYSFTTTSHLCVTLALALMVFIAVNIICFNKHGLHMFSLFLPAGTNIVLAFLMIPIELISYIFKPISLAVRLFANMMAGHTLLKVIAGFTWQLMFFTNILFAGYIFCLIILIIFFGLETAVAMIQTYVFTMLSIIYIRDAIKLH